MPLPWKPDGSNVTISTKTGFISDKFLRSGGANCSLADSEAVDASYDSSEDYDFVGQSSSDGEDDEDDDDDDDDDDTVTVSESMSDEDGADEMGDAKGEDVKD